MIPPGKSVPLDVCLHEDEAECALLLTGRRRLPLKLLVQLWPLCCLVLEWSFGGEGLLTSCDGHFGRLALTLPGEVDSETSI